MKSFPYSPRTERFARHSIGSVLSPGAGNFRTLSPSMPNSGHVSSIKSTWENRTKLSDRLLSPKTPSRKSLDRKSLDRKSLSNTTRVEENAGDGNNVRSTWNRNRVSTGRKSFSGDQENADAHTNNTRPSWNRTKTVKTTNTGRKSFSGTTYEQENAGDANNQARPSWHEEKSAEQKHQQHHQPRTSNKKIRDNAWVRKTDTDDTTSLSSNEVSIQKTSSNISDVSAPSVASSNHWRYRANNGQQSHHRVNKVEIKSCAEANSHRGIENCTSVTTGPSRAGVLASKLASESLGIKGVSSSGDDSSTLNYSLEKLPEDEEEDMHSRPSMGGRRSVGDDQSAKPSLSVNINSIEAKLSKDRASLDQVNPSHESNASSTCMGDSLQAYVDLSSRLNQKISSVPSTDTDLSLVYSLANTDEPSKYNYDSAYSYDQDDPDPSDLVASTLAECRLLLEMSPPPTPAYSIKSPATKKTAQVKMAMPPRSPAITPRSPAITPRSPAITLSVAAVPSTASSPANSTASVGLTKFLQCPCCHKEFTNDTSCETNKNRRPLHSFACDHIVCYECVFLADGNAMVPCPVCGEARAFDKTRPVVSRSYCMLVKSIEIMNSGKKGTQKVHRLSSDDDEDRRGDREGKGRDSVVPTQIELFSPTREEISVANDESPEEGLTRDLSISLGSKTDDKREDASTFPYANEPDTPVSRAEFRFWKRKEKLAQSLEKVNRLLERSKMNKDEVSLNKIEENLHERAEDSEELFEGTALNRMSLNNTHAEEAEESGYEEEHEVMPDEERDDADELHEMLNDTLAGNSEVARNTGFRKPTIDTLWTDEGLDWTLPKQQQIAQKRAKPELRVDTGNYTPLPRRKNPYLDLKDESTASYESCSKPTEVNCKNDTVAPVTGIFRKSPISPPVVFGTLGNGSQDSSLTDRDNDNQYLLGGSVSTKSGLSSLKEKKYGLHRSPPKDNKAASAEKQQRSAEEPRCPQFLPSLTYSTMHESDEMVGLVREKDGTRRAAASRKLHYSTPNKLFTKQRKNGQGTRLSFGKVESYDEGGIGGNYSARANYDRIAKMDSFASQDDDGRCLLKGPTYDFAQHSCSFSPSAESRSLRGALVTHKPRFHKKVLSKFAFKGRKQYARRR